jgi:hypothetical protein
MTPIYNLKKRNFPIFWAQEITRILQKKDPVPMGAFEFVFFTVLLLF